MEIPPSLKIGGHKIKIEFNDTAHGDGKGSFNNYHNLIRLEKENDTPEDNVAECFLHEIFEAIKKKNNLELSHIELTVLSENLYQVLHDNKLNF
ncbi:MAG: hypothetical protein KKB31_04295 [Nanoarchaeota archaeon]|nr:hypothetical protein [Nanoarchaeota archaeon]